MQKLDLQTFDSLSNNIEALQKLFPQVITEKEDDKGNIVKAIDFDLFKQFFSSELVEDNDERYNLNWPGKKASILKANTPTQKTLRPVKKDSVDFDNTENIYIEGDNFEVLKVLQESYLGKVKMIYIDPPYNTGKDFVYKDNFKVSKEEYEDDLGVEDEEGGKLFRNTDTNGRFHSDWLSMMYERLVVARDLLKDDGVIFMSIDESEYVNLKKICDEIYGEENYVENFIWIKNSTKNNSKTTSTNHEYILCYAKNKQNLEDQKFFRIKKAGFDEVMSLLKNFEKENLSIDNAESELKKFYKKNPQLKGISSYDRLEYKKQIGQEQMHCQLYTLADASAPVSTGTGPMYDVIHPITKKICKTPSTGWRFTEAKMSEHIKNGLIYFYEDETKVPRFKRYLNNVETDVLKSTFDDFTDGKKEMQRLFDMCPFDNPKPSTLISKYTQLTNKNDIILDFFSGSATTAHAVMQLNAEDGGKRKFIMVQIPELTDEKSEAYKAGYKNICEIGKERIRRAGKKILEDKVNSEGRESNLGGNKDKLAERETPLDTGFRVYSIDSSNMKDVYFHPNEIKQIDLFNLESNIKEDRSPLDLLTGVMLDLGLTLDLPIESKTIAGNEVFFVAGNSLVACFDEYVDFKIVDEIAKLEPLKVVFRDASFRSDSDKINFETRMKKLSPETGVYVI